MKLVRRVIITSFLLIILVLLTRRASRLETIIKTGTKSFREIWLGLVEK